MVLEQLDIPSIWKKKRSRHRPYKPFTKFNSKWITDLNVKHKTIKLLQDNTGENLDEPGFVMSFYTPPKAQSVKEKTDVGLY